MIILSIMINSIYGFCILTQQLHDQVYMGKDLQDPAKANQDEFINI
jgi:hypothetical protein